jgi:hypothetical protein
MGDLKRLISDGSGAKTAQYIRYIFSRRLAKVI